MSVFTPKAIRQVGRLAFDALAIGRGEQLVKRRPTTQPHHHDCPACGFDRWDGRSEHRWGGKLGAQRTCFGPEKVVKPQAPTKGPSHPLVDELRMMASTVGGELEPERIEPERPEGYFEDLGDARE